MRVLLACEESQRVTEEFRKHGHDAFSCDLLPSSGNMPEYHYQCDVREIINDGWDIVLAFPPCTYLTNAGNRWFNVERYGEKAVQRYEYRRKAIEFFMLFVNCECNHIAIENPIGCMSTIYRKPDQIIHPYMFGDPERKSTCLWLKNLPELKPTEIVKPEIYEYKNGKGTDSKWHMESMNMPPKERAIYRSKTFPGIARAMAEQWGNYEQIL